MKNKINNIYSVRYRIVRGVMILIIPICVILILLLMRIKVTTEETAYHSGSVNVELYLDNLRNAVDAVDTSMDMLLLGNQEIIDLNIWQTKVTTYLLGYDMQQQLSAPVRANNQWVAMMLYSLPNDYLFTNYSSRYNVRNVYASNESARLEALLVMMCRDNTVNMEQWFLVEFDERPLFCRIKSQGSVYCIAVMDLQMVSEQLSYAQEVVVAFTDQTGKVLTNQAFLDSHSLKLPDASDEYSVSGGTSRYMTINGANDYFSFYYCMAYDGQHMIRNTLEIVLILCVLIAFAAIPLMMFYLRRHVLNPVAKLGEKMQISARGESAEMVDYKYTTSEFLELDHIFEQMLIEIKDLKISAYEKELSRQRTEFQRLQLQIRPHFYLNCMKSMYSLAQNGQINEMKKSIIFLSDHLRYIFTADTELIPLKQEVWQCKNYIELLGSSQQITCDFQTSIKAGLEEQQIPPISLLTFIENSIKYYPNNGQKPEIHLTVQQLNTGDQTYLQIIIADNGPGFPNHYLDRLNHYELIIDDQGSKHIGIYNVINRCQFIYGSDFQFAAMNRNGARITLLIPLHQSK